MSSPYSRGGCELPVEPGAWAVACRDFVTHQLHMILCVSYQCSYPGMTAEKTSCAGMAGTEQSMWCQVLKKCLFFVVILSTPVTAKDVNQATPLATKSIWSFSWLHTHLRIVGALLLVSLLLSHKQPNIQLNRRMIILGFKNSYSLVPYALWDWENVAWWLNRI